MGPRAGRKGGNIVAAGTFDDILRSDTITADYLTGRRRIEIPETLRKGTGGRIVIRGARGNNLKNVTAEFPLGKFICVTGVSGSGKSTLVNETLRPILARELYRSFDQPLEYDGAEGLNISTNWSLSTSRPSGALRGRIPRPIRTSFPTSASCSR